MKSNQTLDPRQIKKAKVFFTQGKTHFKEKNFGQAIVDFEHACSLDKTWQQSFELNYYLTLAIAYFMPKDQDTPKASFEEILQRAENTILLCGREELRKKGELSELYTIEGRALSELWKVELNKEGSLSSSPYLPYLQPSKIVECFATALKYDPKNHAAINGLANFLREWNDFSLSSDDERNNPDPLLHGDAKGIFSAIKLLPQDKQINLLRLFLLPPENQGRFGQLTKDSKILDEMRAWLEAILHEWLRKNFITAELHPATEAYDNGIEYLSAKKYKKAIFNFELFHMLTPTLPPDRGNIFYAKMAYVHYHHQCSLPVEKRNFGRAFYYISQIKEDDPNVRNDANFYALRSNILYSITELNKGTSKLLTIPGSDLNNEGYIDALTDINHALGIQKKFNGKFLEQRMLINARLKKPVDVLDDIARIEAERKKTKHVYPDHQTVVDYLHDYLWALDEDTLNLVSNQQIINSIKLLPENDQILVMRKCLYDLSSPLAKRLRSDRGHAYDKVVLDQMGLEYLRKIGVKHIKNKAYLPDDLSNFHHCIQLGKTFYKAKKYKEAKQCVDQAISIYEFDKTKLNAYDSSLAYYFRGILHYRMHQYEDGLEEMEKAGKLYPSVFSLGFYSKLADCSTSSGKANNDGLFNLTGALRALYRSDHPYAASQYFAPSARKKDTITLAASYYFQAIYFTKMKDKGLFIVENIMNALKADPNFTPAADLLIKYLSEVSQSDMKDITNKHLLSTIKLLPTKQRIDLLKYIIYESNGKSKLLHDRLLSNNDHNSDRTWSYIKGQLIEFDPEGFAEYRKNLSKKDSDSIQMHFSLANSFYKKGNFEKARFHYAKHRELDLTLNHGLISFKEGMNTASLEKIKQALSLFEAFEAKKNKTTYRNQDTTALVNLSLANLFLMKDSKDLIKALESCNKAIEMQPDFADAYHVRGLVHYVNKNFDDAIKDYKKAIKLSPKYADANLQLALAYEAVNNKAEAVKYYVKAILMDEKYKKAYNQGEFKNEKKQLNPLFSLSHDKDFCPHLTTVNQALALPTHKLADLLLNIKAGELDSVDEHEIINIIRALPPKKRVPLLEACLLKNHPLGLRLKSLNLDEMLAIERDLESAKIITSKLSEILPEQKPLQLQGAVIIQPTKADAVPLPVNHPVQNPLQDATAPLQTNVRPATPVLQPMYIPVGTGMPEPVAFSDQVPVYAVKQLVEAPLQTNVRPAAPVLQPMYIPVGAGVPKSGVFPEQSPYVYTAVQPVFLNTQPNESIPPTMVPIPQFTVVQQPLYHSIYTVSPEEQAPQPQAIFPVYIAPKSVSKPTSTPPVSPSPIYNAAKVTQPKSEELDLNANPIEEMRSYLIKMDKAVNTPTTPWTIKSLFKKEKPGTPTHIKEIQDYLREWKKRPYDTALVFYFNKIVNVLTGLKESSYRTDLVKRFDDVQRVKGTAIQKLYERQQAKANKETFFQPKQAEKAAATPVAKAQEPFKQTVLTPVYIATKKKDPLDALKALPPAPNHKPTFFDQVKKAVLGEPKVDHSHKQRKKEKL